jgi:hypothetical protein
MNRTTFTRAKIVFAALGLVLGAVPTLAQQDVGAPSDEKQPRVRAAQEHVQQLELREADGERIELIDHPLLAYDDPARVNSNGTVWAWGKTGRPLAFLELFQGSSQDTSWVHAVTSTSAGDVSLTIPQIGKWHPPAKAIEWHVIKEAPPPDTRTSARLRQIKDLARRFTGHEFWDPDNSRFELRVLPQPVHRYSDPSAQIQDGAALIIAHGTNPETVLLIEAVGASPKEARWQYALARSSHAEAHVELDGHEVWKCDRAGENNSGPAQSYWLFNSP